MRMHEEEREPTEATRVEVAGVMLVLVEVGIANSRDANVVRDSSLTKQRQQQQPWQLR